MGKATIKTNIGEGKYLVDLALNTGLRQPAIDKIDAIIKQKNDHTATTQEILDKQIIETGKLVTASGLVVDEIIVFQETYQSTKATLTASLSDADYVVAGAEVEVEDADYILSSDRAELAAMEAEKARIIAFPAPGNVPGSDLMSAIAQSQANIISDDQDFTDRKAELAAAVKTRDGIKSQIDGMKSEIPKALQDKMASAIKAVNDSRYLESLYRTDLAQTAMDIQSAQLQKKALETLPDKKEITAWCADYTTDLVGEVATIDIPGEVGAIPTLLGAGFTPEPYDKTKDGGLVNLELMSPEQAWFNLSILPYLNEFKPRFRRAHITAINGDLCDVELKAIYTKFTPTIDVTKVMHYEGTGANVAAVGKTALTKVPFAYMDCHSAAFEVGDFVVVEFTDRDPAKPKVIGFVENPRECNPHGFGITVDNNKKIIQKKAGVYKLTERSSLNFGSLFDKLKIGVKWYVVSWIGPFEGAFCPYGIHTHSGQFVYCNGKAYQCQGDVFGVRLKDEAGIPYIYMVADSSVYKGKFPDGKKTTIDWILLGKYGDYDPVGFTQYVSNNPAWNPTFGTGQLSIWEFNESCTEIAAVFFAYYERGMYPTGQLTGIIIGYSNLYIEYINPVYGNSTKRTLWVGYSGDSIKYVNHISTFQGEGNDAEKSESMEYDGIRFFGYDMSPMPQPLYSIRPLFLNPKIGACVTSGWDVINSVSICNMYYKWNIIISGDNQQSGDIYAPGHTTEFLSIYSGYGGYPREEYPYQVLEDIDNNVLFCIYDYYTNTSYITVYTKGMIITNGDIHMLTNNADNIMPVGVI
jgi:hypothetical protein